MTTEQLHRAIAYMARIDAAGWLGDLERDLADWREPFTDPAHGVYVARIARAASRILGVSPRNAHAATEAVLMPTRQRHALELIEWYGGGLTQEGRAK